MIDAREAAGTTGLVALDLFGGTGGLARWWRSRKIGAIILDMAVHPWLDLTSLAVQTTLIGWVRSRSVHFLLLAPPCASWSRARRGPPGPTGPPAAIRSNQHVLGIPGVSETDQMKLNIGNITLRFCVQTPENVRNKERHQDVRTRVLP